MIIPKFSPEFNHNLYDIYADTNIRASYYFEKFKLMFLPYREVSQMMIIALLFALTPIVIKNIEKNNTPYETNIQPNFSENSLSMFSDKTVSMTIGDSINDQTLQAQQAAAAAAAAATKQSVVVKTVSYHNDPSDFDPIYKAAAARFGTPWQLLKAVHYVESGCSGSTTKASYAGAKGPMQFMSGTWRTYGIDGNGDGVADIYDVTDAIYGAANLLAQSGAANGNIDGALLNYNHSLSYVNKVKEVAASIN